MQNKSAFYIIAVIASIIICVVMISLRREGIPEVQGQIDLQLNNLVSESPSLKGLEVGRENGMRVLSDSSSMKGWFRYDAKLNGSEVDLLVYWEGNSTNCQITKITSSTTYSAPQLIWTANEK
jgi:hypothetical protein